MMKIIVLFLRRSFILIILNLSFFTCIYGQNTGRVIIPLNQHWQMTHNNDDSLTNPLSEGNWEKVILPDIRRVEDESSGFLWYSASFPVDKKYISKRIYISFDRINGDAGLFINGKLAGEHSDCFTPWTAEITSFIIPGKPNNILVQIHKHYQTSSSGTMETEGYTGLYPPISLIITNKVNISLSDITSSGSLIVSGKVNDSIAKVYVRTRLENHSGHRRSIELRCTVWDNKEFVTRDVREIELDTTGVIAFVQDLDFGIPSVWNGTERPYLYKLHVEIREKGTILDAVTQPLALRSFGFDSIQRFVLNNTLYPLYGVEIQLVNDHSDMKTMVSNLKKEFRSIIAVGGNTVVVPDRLLTGSLCSLCDSLGLVIVPKTSGLQKNDNKVNPEPGFFLRNFNHPSLLIRQSQNDHPLEGKIDANALRFAISSKDVWSIPPDSINKSKYPDRYYWYKTRWSVKPAIYFTTKPDTVSGKTLNVVRLYCNLEDPVIVVNGKTFNQGEKGSSIDFSWKNIELKKGKNTFRAWARKKGIRCEDSWEFMAIDAP
ncbi:MAG: hypothetical protein NTX61_09435 [Bacteroidetes bacterium]|nr:hypothetical protein [Bacteroidota bacterium]